MDDNDRRNINDFYAHRALVLKRIIQALAALKAEKQSSRKEQTNIRRPWRNRK